MRWASVMSWLLFWEGQREWRETRIHKGNNHKNDQSTQILKCASTNVNMHSIHHHIKLTDGLSDRLSDRTTLEKHKVKPHLYLWSQHQNFCIPVIWLIRIAKSSVNQTCSLRNVSESRRRLLYDVWKWCRLKPGMIFLFLIIVDQPWPNVWEKLATFLPHRPLQD